MAGTVCLAGTVLGLAGPAPSGSVRLACRHNGCWVRTSRYVLRFDIFDPPLFRLFAPDGTRELLSFGGLCGLSSGGVFTWTTEADLWHIFTFSAKGRTWWRFTSSA